MSLEAISKTVANASWVWIRGTGTKDAWRVWGEANDIPMNPATEVVELETGIIDFSPNDQVVSVRAGTPIAQLQEALREYGQCLPILEATGTVGGCLSLNLPHLLEGKCGSWRDWTLGMTYVLGDGTIAKSGSHAVKNVAGYDIHKLMIGARGTLALIGEVILRTYPVKSLPEVDLTLQNQAMQLATGKAGPNEAVWIQRVLRTDFDEAAGTTRAFGGLDVPDTSTLWRVMPKGTELRRFSGDWVLRTGDIRIVDPDMRHYMRRALDAFFQWEKFNPGAIGSDFEQRPRRLDPNSWAYISSGPHTCGLPSK